MEAETDTGRQPGHLRKKATKKSSKLCGDSCLITSKTPRLPQESEVTISSDSPPQIVPFATVGQLLVCPPRPVPFAAGTAFGVCPFPRACPARHGPRILLARRASIFWFLSWYWIFFLLSRGKSVLFARNPLKSEKFSVQSPRIPGMCDAGAQVLPRKLCKTS